MANEPSDYDIRQAEDNAGKRARQILTENTWIQGRVRTAFIQHFKIHLVANYKDRWVATSKNGTVRVQNFSEEELHVIITRVCDAVWNGPPPQEINCGGRAKNGRGAYIYPTSRSTRLFTNGRPLTHMDKDFMAQNYGIHAFDISSAFIDEKQRADAEEMDAMMKEHAREPSQARSRAATPAPISRPASQTSNKSNKSEYQDLFKQFMISRTPTPIPTGIPGPSASTRTHRKSQEPSPGPGDKRGNSAIRTPTHERSMEVRTSSPSSGGSNPAAGHSPSRLPVPKRPRAGSSTSNFGVTQNRTTSVPSSPLAPTSSRNTPSPASTGSGQQQGYTGKGKGRRL